MWIHFSSSSFSCEFWVYIDNHSFFEKNTELRKEIPLSSTQKSLSRNRSIVLCPCLRRIPRIHNNHISLRYTKRLNPVCRITSFIRSIVDHSYTIYLGTTESTKIGYKWKWYIHRCEDTIMHEVSSSEHYFLFSFSILSSSIDHYWDFEI